MRSEPISLHGEDQARDPESSPPRPAWWRSITGTATRSWPGGRGLPVWFPSSTTTGASAAPFASGAPPDVRWPEATRPNGTILVSPNSDTIEIWSGDNTRSAFLGYHPYAETYEIPVQNEWELNLYPVVYRQTRKLGLWGDLVFIGALHGYEIRAYRADGTLARIVRRDIVPRAPSQAEIDHYVSTGALYHESAQIAESFPAFSDIMGDGAGYLWVREYDFPLEERPAPLWTVFGPGGRVLGFLETPATLQIKEIGEDYILGRVVDEMGVESIQLWPLERAGG